VLARMWKREVEAAIAPPLAMPPSTPRSTSPNTPPKRPSVEVLLESPGALGADSPPTSRRRKRKKSSVPVERIWLRDRETPPPPRPTPYDHARQLLRWVRKSGYEGKMVLAMDLEKIYPAMCEELDWLPHKWQPVAVELRQLTGKRKVYRWVDGHRRRAYPV
jgi:hypothetical protein